MDRETLRKVQLTQLEMAKELKRVCEENGIKYFLDSGTLLGAVRHKGFIPWDDDMDFGMLRDDYERFVRIAPEKIGKEYFLQTWDSDEKFAYPFAKLRKLGTTYVEAVSQETGAHNELYIDILPYDELTTVKVEKKKIQRSVWWHCNALFMQTGLTPWKRHKSIIKKILVHIKYIPYRIFAFMHDRETLKREYKETMTKYNGTGTGFYFEQFGAVCGKHPVPAHCFASMTELEFEGELFPAPGDSHCYLESVYGDYMKLPPKDQRENRHQIIELKL